MMHVVDLIKKKRDGNRLSHSELQFLVDGYVNGTIPDYQMAAWNMAVFFQGMEPEEITDLTLTMAKSGEMLDLSAINGMKIDKHSTGGVGDTTTLVVAPLVASFGVPVAKMSGRGLGHTGGTIDKLESIPGFKVDLKPEDFVNQVNDVGVSVVGQSGQLAPADKLLYSLRDVTATVESIPLIASSIMSKKIAAGADAFVLDVKTGSGAFMKNQQDAVKLAKTMVQIGLHSKRTTVAIITDMNQPLGRGIGNSLEIKEAILTLQGHGAPRLTELCIELAAIMIELAGITSKSERARELVKKNLMNKKALVKFSEMIEAQGGNPSVIDDLSLLPQASFRQDILATKTGYITEIDPMEVGITAMQLGAGRENKDTVIDLGVGLELKHQIGDFVNMGDTLATVYANDKRLLEDALARGASAFVLDMKNPPLLPLIYGKITAEDV